MRNDYYQTAYNKMGYRFSSNEFTKCLREMDVPDDMITSYMIRSFMNGRARRVSSHQWVKGTTYNGIRQDKSKYYSDFEQILASALNDMPEFFSSIDFGERARHYGLPEPFIRNHGMASWLEMHTERLSSKKWRKKISLPNGSDSTLSIDVKKAVEIIKENGYEIMLDEAVKIVKAAGYRIMKPKTEWEEL